MPANPVLWNLDERGVATVTLNRPEVNNAYDAGLIGGVLSAMDELSQKPLLRVVVLKGNGKHFQAGADLKWINAVRPQSPAENEAVSQATFEAVAETKALAMESSFGGMRAEDEAFARLVRMHAAKRQAPEASEGLASFAEKRAANWVSKT